MLAERSACVSLASLRECRKLEEGIAYWDALDYFGQCVLGWADPSHGMRWWYAKGCRLTGNPWLDLITRHWNDRGHSAKRYHLWVDVDLTCVPSSHGIRSNLTRIALQSLSLYSSCSGRFGFHSRDSF